MSQNEYLPFLSKIQKIIQHTDIEYTFRMSYEGDVKPGQFFEVSIPKFGEAPISVSGIGEGFIDLTIRKVGKVTNEIFDQFAGGSLFLRGPYGNGFDVNLFKGKELIIVAGGTGVSPVKGVVDYFYNHKDEVKDLTLIAGFKSPGDVLFRDEFACWQEKINVVLTVDKLGEAKDSKEIIKPMENQQSLKFQEGLVTKYIPDLKISDKNNTMAIVVGPPIMMKFAVKALLDKGFVKENIYISHERKMCCGIGKCGHCKIDDVYICLDGPVFNYVKGIALVD